MKRILALLSVTAMMLALTAMPAMAQISGPVQVNAANLISVLNNPNVTITDVQVVDVVDVNNNRVNVNVLQNFLNQNNINVDIRNLIGNVDIDALNNNTVTIQDVEILSDGTLLISI